MSYEFQRQDVYDIARHIGGETKEKGNELFFKYCPYCNGNHKDTFTFSINLDTGQYKCFRASCDHYGNIIELARDFRFKLGNFESHTNYRKLPQKRPESKSEALSYMLSRGISEQITKKYKVTVQKQNKSILVFPFYDEDGVLQFVKYRNMKYNGKGNKEWCEKNTKPILFGMEQCEDFERLVITEGQIDSLSLAEAGIKNAVSVPIGCNGFTWIPHCWEWLEKFKEVVVFGDYENGKMTLLETLQQRMPQKVKAVRPEDYLMEKDANAILTKYGKNALVTAIKNAEVPKMKNVKDLSTVQNIDINSLHKIKTNITELDRAIGGLVMGQVILLSGKRGNGKSTFMSQLVCEALDQNENVFVYSGELADYHFKRWLDFQLAGANNVVTTKNQYGDLSYSLSNETVDRISKWYKNRIFIYDNNFIPDNKSEIETLEQTIENVIRQHNVKLICIDNLMTAMECVSDQNNLYLAQSNFVGNLKKIAAKYDVVVILIAHPRKSKNEFNNDDVSGSSDITNKVDVVMSYERTENEFNCDGKLQITKNRLFGKYLIGENAIELSYMESTKRITSKKSKHIEYGWEKEITLETDGLPFGEE